MRSAYYRHYWLTFLCVAAFCLPVAVSDTASSHSASLKEVLKKTSTDTGKISAINHWAFRISNNQPDSSIKLGKKALQMARNLPAQTDQQKAAKLQYTAQVLHNLGVFHKKTSNYSMAIHYLRKALDNFKQLADSDDKKTARVGKVGLSNNYSEMGNIYQHQSSYHKAQKQFFKALKINKALDDKKRMAGSYNELGILFARLSAYSRSLKYFFKTLAIKKEQNNKKGMASSYANIGNIYWYQKDLDKALEYYLKSLEIIETLNNKAYEAKIYDNIGLIHTNKNNFKKALNYHTKALKIEKELGNKRGYASTCYNIGVLFTSVYKYRDSLDINYSPGVLEQDTSIALGSGLLLDSALVLHKKAHRIARSISDEHTMAFSLSGAGEVFLTRQQYESAALFFNRAYKLADSIGAARQAMGIAQNLYKTYKKLGRHPQALKWHEKYIQHKEAIFNKDKQQALGRQEAEYKWKQKMVQEKKQKALAQERSKQQQLIIWGVSGGLLILLASLGLLYNRYRLINEQKNTIQQQKQERDAAYSALDQKSRQLTDSIQYAKRIQQAVLVPPETIQQAVGDSFVLLKPQSIVSGDFYYFARVDGHTILSVIDCTGHGVPGAFMSLIGNDLLNQIVHDQSITSPDQALNELDKQLEQSLRQATDLKKELGVEPQDYVRDGMDLAMCVLSPDESGKKSNKKEGVITLHYAGANNPLYVVSGSTLKVKGSKIKTFQPDNLQHSNIQLYEIPPDKQPIGKQAEKEPFTDKTVQLKKGDTFYIFSDGYPDQMGGPENKKFLYTRFRELLLSIQDQPMEKQRQILDQNIEDWKKRADEDQTDDICVMGVRV